jgi:hypothetical protein
VRTASEGRPYKGAKNSREEGFMAQKACDDAEFLTPKTPFEMTSGAARGNGGGSVEFDRLARRWDRRWNEVEKRRKVRA